MECKEIIHNDRTFYVQALKLDAGGLIYVGDSSLRMDNMSLVHMTHYVTYI